MLAVGLFRYDHSPLGYLKDRLVGISRGKDVSCVPTSKLTMANVGRWRMSGQGQHTTLDSSWMSLTRSKTPCQNSYDVKKRLGRCSTRWAAGRCWVLAGHWEGSHGRSISDRGNEGRSRANFSPKFASFFLVRQTNSVAFMTQECSYMNYSLKYPIVGITALVLNLPLHTAE